MASWRACPALTREQRDKIYMPDLLKSHAFDQRFQELYTIKYLLASYKTFLMSLETDNDSVMETKQREEPASKKPGRGWRFYGTFA
jgi:hypothetical protein